MIEIRIGRTYNGTESGGYINYTNETTIWDVLRTQSELIIKNKDYSHWLNNLTLQLWNIPDDEINRERSFFFERHHLSTPLGEIVGQYNRWIESDGNDIPIIYEASRERLFDAFYGNMTNIKYDKRQAFANLIVQSFGREFAKQFIANIQSAIVMTDYKEV